MKKVYQMPAPRAAKVFLDCYGYVRALAVLRTQYDQAKGNDKTRKYLVSVAQHVHQINPNFPI